MMTERNLFQNAKGNICRRCINKKYHTNLKRSDCLYGIGYPCVCGSCGTVQNIVIDLRLRGKIKLFFR